MDEIKIPKIIHQINVHENYPFKELSDTWIKIHPSWKYKLWNKKDIEIFLKKTFPEEDFIIRKTVWNDWDWYTVRYLIIYFYGGLFVNYDFEAIENIERNIRNKSCFLSYQPNTFSSEGNHHLLSLSDSIIGVSVKHPFIEHIVFYILKHKKNKSTDSINMYDSVLSKCYNEFKDKESIYIFDHKVFIPLSQKEVRLYFNGKIEEKMIEEKIKDAVAIRYYYIPPKTKVLYFSSSDGDGGAFNAAYRIHCGLLKIGIESKMLVQKSVKEKPNIYLTPQKNKNDKAVLQGHKLYSGIVGINIKKYIDIFEPEIVQLHWINDGFIKIEDLKKIKHKIVWRLPDCWPFTGGCHYFGECEGYTYLCGKCPILNSSDEKDLSYEIMERKMRAWKDLDMTIVVPSKWMKNLVKKSSLFYNRRIETIPNGLDMESFYPLDKYVSRKVLQLSGEKKIILFGAYYPFSDKRKGFHYLKPALMKLLDKYHEELEIVIFGEESVPTSEVDLPINYIGKFIDELSLRIVYSCADVMVVPSIDEAFGQTASEALACGTPVVVFDNTGPEDIIDHQINGFIAEKENYISLAEGIEWVICDNERNKRLSQNARKKAEECYDYKKIAESYKLLYDYILTT